MPLRFSCDLPLAVSINIAIPFTKDILDASFDINGTQCLGGAGVYQVGSAFLLLWALSNSALHNMVHKRWNGELFEVY